MGPSPELTCLFEASAASEGLSANPRFPGGRNCGVFSACCGSLSPGSISCGRRTGSVAKHASGDVAAEKAGDWQTTQVKSALDPWEVCFPCHRRPSSHSLALGRVEPALIVFVTSHLSPLSPLPHSCVICFCSVAVMSYQCSSDVQSLSHLIPGVFLILWYKSGPPLAFRWLSDLVWPDSSSLPCGPFQHSAGLWLTLWTCVPALLLVFGAPNLSSSISRDPDQPRWTWV